MEEFYTNKTINGKVSKVLMVGQPLEFNFQDEAIIKAHIYKENGLWYVVDDATGTSINTEFGTKKGAIISVEMFLDKIVNITKTDLYAKKVQEFADLQVTGELMLKDKIRNLVDGRPFQVVNGESLYVDYDSDKNVLYAGTITNSGIIRDYSIKYNKEASIDNNLERLYETINEKQYRQGSSLGV